MTLEVNLTVNIGRPHQHRWNRISTRGERAQFEEDGATLAAAKDVGGVEMLSKQTAGTHNSILYEFKGTKFKAQTNIVATRFQLSPTVIYLLYSFPIPTFCQSPDTDATIPSPIAANTRAAPNPPAPDGVAPHLVCYFPHSRCFGCNWKRRPGSERMYIGIGNALPTSISYPSRLPKHCHRN